MFLNYSESFRKTCNLNYGISSVCKCITAIGKLFQCSTAFPVKILHLISKLIWLTSTSKLLVLILLLFASWKSYLLSHFCSPHEYAKIVIKWSLNHTFAKLNRLSSKSFTIQHTSNSFIILTTLAWIISSFQCPSRSTPIWNQHSSLFQNNAKYGDNITSVLQLLGVWSLWPKHNTTSPASTDDCDSLFWGKRALSLKDNCFLE